MKSITTDKIIPIRALKDNYIWAILNEDLKQVIVIDPGDAHPVIDMLKKLNYSLAGILITHHHWDHTNGIDELLNFAGNIPVIASHLSPLTQVTQRVKENDEIILADMVFKAFEIPGHTLDHIAYFNDMPLLFTGDTLFSAGCGRIFEGTPEMMFNTLNKISTFSDETKIYCGHEYTANNLRFAATVEPQNSNIQMKATHLKSCTLPSILGEEKTFNPFLRCLIPDVHQAAEKFSGKKLTTPLEVFTVLREWKNNSS